MKIDNFTRDYRTGDITTTIRSGHTLTHAPECKLYSNRPMGMVDFADCCDCYISLVSLVPLADGTVTAIPGEYIAEKIRREEGRTPGDEAAFDMWKNRALKAEGERWKWAGLGSAIGSVTAMAVYFLGRGFIEGWW